MCHTKAIALPLALIVLFSMAACAPKEAVIDQSPTPAAVLTPTPLDISDDDASAMAEAHTPPPQPTPVTFPADGYICKEGVNLRAEPSVSSAIVDVLGENAPIDIVSLQDGWYRVSLEGVTAYVREDMAEIGAPPRKHNMYWAKATVAEAQMYKTPSNLELSERKLVMDEVVKVLRTLDGYSHVVCSDHLQRYVLSTELTKITDEEAEEWRANQPTATPATESSAEQPDTEADAEAGE